MLVVTRYTVPESQGVEFRERAATAMRTLAARPGYLRGRLGRATDDPSRWVLTTEWESVGAYRRALSAYEVRVGAVPLLSLAEDEPTAYEILDAGDDSAAGDGPRTRRAADADVVAVGEAAAPYVPTALDDDPRPPGR